MNKLQKLLALSTDGMSVEELDAHLSAIAAAAAELAESDASDDALDLLDTAAEAANTVRTLISDAAADAEARTARAAAAIAAITGAEPEASTDADGEGDGEPAEGETPDPEAEAETPDPEASTDPEAETPEGEVIDDATGETDPEATEALAAAASTPTPAVSRVAARRPASTVPRVSAQGPDFTKFSLVAAGNGGAPYGQKLEKIEDVAAVLQAGIESAGMYEGPAVRVPLARAKTTFPEQFQLSESAVANSRYFRTLRDGVRKHGSLPQLAAAGGACAPYDVWYDQPTVGTDRRPVRDTLLNRVGAPRGGITVLPTITYADVAGGVSFWDDDNGHVLDDSGTTTKPYVEVDCDDPIEVDTYSVVQRVRFGNFKARYFPERVDAILRQLGVAHARKAEVKLLQLLGAASIQVTSGQLLGTTRSTLAALDRGLAAYRSRYRLDPNTPLAFAYPFWLIDQMRTDLAREAPGASDERLAAADATIENFLKARKVVLKPFLDGESGQVFGAQGAGPLLGWPSTAVTYIYPEGDAHFLDGGMLDIGVVRDSTLNGQNKYEIFSETSEGFLYHSATDPLRLVIDTCPDGTTSAPVTLSGLCSTGS